MLSNIVADIKTIRSLQLILKGGLITLIDDFIEVFERWKALLEEDGGNTKSIVLNDLQVYIETLKGALKKNGTN